jgi:hypothetical protein
VLYKYKMVVYFKIPNDFLMNSRYISFYVICVATLKRYCELCVTSFLPSGDSES